MKNESIANAHKIFLPLLPGTQSKHRTDQNALPTYSQHHDPCSTHGNAGGKLQSIPTAFTSDCLPAFAIFATVGLQQHVGFLEVISTFRPKATVLHRTEWQGCPLLFFSPLSFCAKLHLAEGNLERWGGWDAVPEWDIGAIPLLSILRMSLKGCCHLSTLAVLKPVQTASSFSILLGKI